MVRSACTTMPGKRCTEETIALKREGVGADGQVHKHVAADGGRRSRAGEVGAVFDGGDSDVGEQVAARVRDCAGDATEGLLRCGVSRLGEAEQEGEGKNEMLTSLKKHHCCTS